MIFRKNGPKKGEDSTQYALKETLGSGSGPKLTAEEWGECISGIVIERGVTGLDLWSALTYTNFWDKKSQPPIPEIFCEVGFRDWSDVIELLHLLRKLKKNEVKDEVFRLPNGATMTKGVITAPPPEPESEEEEEKFDENDESWISNI